VSALRYPWRLTMESTIMKIHHLLCGLGLMGVAMMGCAVSAEEPVTSNPEAVAAAPEAMSSEASHDGIGLGIGVCLEAHVACLAACKLDLDLGHCGLDVYLACCVECDIELNTCCH